MVSAEDRRLRDGNTSISTKVAIVKAVSPLAG
jgi:hypothetical protein